MCACVCAQMCMSLSERLFSLLMKYISAVAETKTVAVGSVSLSISGNPLMRYKKLYANVHYIARPRSYEFANDRSYTAMYTKSCNILSTVLMLQIYQALSLVFLHEYGKG